jgi:hypothetical protein
MMSARLLTVILGGTVLFGATLLPAASKHSATRAPRQSPSGETDEVALVLKREAKQPLNRQAELKAVLIREPDSPSAHWHSGDVPKNETWRRYDAPVDAETADLLQSYREARYPLISGDYKGHLHLAQWCRKHGLPDQEYAHLTAAIDLAPESERAAIADKLGYRAMGDQWLNREELADLGARAKKTNAGLKLWSRKLERIANQLSGGPHHRQIALESLQEIRDPAAIPAIELYLATRDQNDAVAAMQTIDRIESCEASLALARHAVFSPWPAVRESAAESLKSREFDDFVPPLLDLLSTPVALHQALVPGLRRGELFYTQILARETANQVEASAIFVPQNVMVFPILTIICTRQIDSPAIAIEGVQTPFAQIAALAEPQNVALREARDRFHEQELLFRVQDDQTTEMNNRLTYVLSKVSGKKQSRDARDWWNWWSIWSGTKRRQPKRVVVARRITTPVPVPIITNQVGINVVAAPARIGMHSCFKAGTPVWTETGMVPIERIQIGDRVLAQNVETGELAYKPVLDKTLRDPTELLRIAVGDEELQCTGGHRFWVAGEGWTKARELTHEDLVHTATATIRIDTVATADTDETHNLVVADFHSYFVGRQAFLVQDLPLPRSTNCVVPGLQPEW